jgi:hypothetical protein
MREPAGTGVSWGPNGQYTKYVLITPEVAKAFLEKNRVNRPLNEVFVDKLVYAMKNGKYEDHHQGICFDVNDDVADGQHNLHAIVKSGFSFWKTVTYNVQVRARGAIDKNRVRNDRDNMAILGYQKITTKEIACIYATLLGLRYNFRQNRPSLVPEQIDDLRQEWAKELAIVAPYMNVRLFGNAVVTSICLRAIMSGESQELVTRFLEVLKTAMPLDHNDEVAIQLRNKMMSGDIVCGRGTASQQDEAYLKISSVLRVFLERRTIRNIVAASRELFIIPPSRIPESVASIFSGE